jgi:hypothetical protein
MSADARETDSLAFAFETGEVWAIDTWLLAGGSRPPARCRHRKDIQRAAATVRRLPHTPGLATTLSMACWYHGREKPPVTVPSSRPDVVESQLVWSTMPVGNSQKEW